MTFDKFTIKAQEAIQEAVNLVQARGQQAIEPEHLLAGILKVGENVTNFLFQKLGVNSRQIEQILESQIASLPKVQGGEPYLSRESNEVLTRAQDYASKGGDEFVSLEPMLLALLTVKSTVSRILKDAGPAWVKYLELNDPKYLRNISSCKSPMEMFAAVLRDKYQAKDAADGRRTYHMAIMPCTAKKMEAARAEFTRDGQPDVDLVITTRELVDMIREAGIQLTELEPEAPDLPFGLGSGAAVIYGVTGGVAEAVVRYCLPDKSNNALQAIRVTDLRGDGAIREVNLTVEGQELHIAIVNGLSHAKELIADVEAGKRFYHLVEVMTCQGGCVGGAGQPYGLTAAKKRRGAGLYEADATAMFKGAEKNPIVTRLLDEYGHERCHELLHVRYGE